MNKFRTISVQIPFFLVIGIFYSKIAYSQLEADYWMFGPTNYVHFNQATQPRALPYPLLSAGAWGVGATSYSDKNGNLLFYGGGWGQMFDRNFKKFPSLLSPYGGDENELKYTEAYTTQPLLTIPYPGHDSLYIVFHIWCNQYNNYQSSLYYSIINMKLRNGLGEIEPGKKNIPLLNNVNVGFKLSAILHCNKKDIWVTGHLLNSDKYYSILVTNNGINSDPVYFAGNFIPEGEFGSTSSNNTGCLKISASGDKMAAAFQGLDLIELFDFNTQTGMGSNLKNISAHPIHTDTVYFPNHGHLYGPWGVEFSPSGEKLYVTSNYEVYTPGNYFSNAFIYQFDASLTDVVAVQNSMILVDQLIGSVGGAIQLANNGKIYVVTSGSLSEIAFPERAGNACGFTPYLVGAGGNNGNDNLPIYLQSYFRYPLISTGNCQSQIIDFSVENLSGVKSISWDFDDPASGANNNVTSFTPTHIFSKVGSFEVKAILHNANGCNPDTIRKLIFAAPLNVFLGNDTTLCRGDTLVLRTKIPGSTNLWSDGTMDSVIKITEPGKYWVTINIGECFTSDSIQVSVRESPYFTLGNDTTICDFQPIQLSTKPDLHDVNYKWISGESDPSITVNQEGNYWLRVEDNYGCTWSDTISIQVNVLPVFDLGADTSLCEQQVISLDATVSGASGYSWSSGHTSSSIQPRTTGIYWAEVSKDNCKYRDSIQVIFNPLPIINLGLDTTLCEGNSILLDAKNPGADYLWQDNTIDQTFQVTNEGQYYSKVILNGCAAADTINIGYKLKPVFSLGIDFGICQGQSIILAPEIKYQSGLIDFTWQNNSKSQSFVVTQPGLFHLTVSNDCGEVSDTIIAKEGVCKLYIPTAFSPNGDGLNDVFKANFGENVISFNMEIYNRWGQRVFHASDIRRGWDGRLNGTMQPHAVYIWIIRYKDFNDVEEKMLKGTTVLLR